MKANFAMIEKASIAVFDSIEFEEEDLISFSKLAARGI